MSLSRRHAPAKLHLEGFISLRGQQSHRDDARLGQGKLSEWARSRGLSASPPAICRDLNQGPVATLRRSGRGSSPRWRSVWCRRYRDCGSGSGCITRGRSPGAAESNGFLSGRVPEPAGRSRVDPADGRVRSCLARRAAVPGRNRSARFTGLGVRPDEEFLDADDRPGLARRCPGAGVRAAAQPAKRSQAIASAMSIRDPLPLSGRRRAGPEKSGEVDSESREYSQSGISTGGARSKTARQAGRSMLSSRRWSRRRNQFFDASVLITDTR